MQMIREVLAEEIAKRRQPIKEYSEEEKRALGIPANAVAKGGVWFVDDKPFGRVLGGKLVKIGPHAGPQTSPEEEKDRGEFDYGYSSEPPDQEEPDDERDRAEFDYGYSYEPPDQEEPSQETLPVKSSEQEPSEQQKKGFEKMLQLDFDDFEDMLDDQLGDDEEKKEKLRQARVQARARLGIDHEHEISPRMWSQHVASDFNTLMAGGKGKAGSDPEYEENLRLAAASRALRMKAREGDKRYYGKKFGEFRQSRKK